ncbi:MAG: YbaK/EbsC family protein [Candidatus Bathyarchaeia archaeon]|nr:YbaK/EbsC family protein [Candidatus Bathyarchaeota archaeon]
MKRGAEDVRRFLRERKVEAEIRELSESTRTSRMAAEALGCDIAQIAKSIVFIDGDATVVVVSGDKRVDEGKLSNLIGRKVYLADAEDVRRYTGYVIGGVPPFPHGEGVRVLLDSSLKRFEHVWTAAGTPNSVFKIRVEDLKAILNTDFVDVSRG